jgi:hypothetical protein
MYNYHRDVLNAQRERVSRRVTGANRQVPNHLRVDNIGRAKSWLSQNAAQPAGVALSAAGRFVALHGGRYWRRASSRTMGLIFTGFESVSGIIPGRT